jgi:outer membrane biosynthesis protein TonB
MHRLKVHSQPEMFSSLLDAVVFGPAEVEAVDAEEVLGVKQEEYLRSKFKRNETPPTNTSQQQQQLQQAQVSQPQLVRSKPVPVIVEPQTAAPPPPPPPPPPQNPPANYQYLQQQQEQQQKQQQQQRRSGRLVYVPREGGRQGGGGRAGGADGVNLAGGGGGGGLSAGAGYVRPRRQVKRYEGPARDRARIVSTLHKNNIFIRTYTYTKIF